MNRPSVTLRCVADSYASPGQRIVEVSSPTGSGCLIALSTKADGTLHVEVYRADPGVTVRGPESGT